MTFRARGVLSGTIAAILLGGNAPGQAPGTVEGLAEGGSRGLVHAEEGATPGLTLIAPSALAQVHLVDLSGEVRHSWETEGRSVSIHLLDDGHLLRSGPIPERRPRPGGSGGRVQELGWDGRVVWQFDLDDERWLQHHQVKPLPGGNRLLIAWERMSREELLARGRDPRFLPDEGLWMDVLLEVRPTLPRGGEIVWMWRAADHAVQERDPGKPRYGKPSEHPGRVDLNADTRMLPGEESDKDRRERERLLEQMRRIGYSGGDAAPQPPGAPVQLDWLHVNSVDVQPEHDLILLSASHLGELWVIDRSTTTSEAASDAGGRWGRGGEILWRWGNPQNHGRGGEEDQQLFFQHDGSWLSGPEGLEILVFNNGRGRAGREHSSLLRLRPPFHPERGLAREAGERFGPAAPEWTYADPERFYAPLISGVRPLPGGNLLVTDGTGGRVFEVTPAGRVVWDYHNPFEGEPDPADRAQRRPARSLLPAVRLAPDHPALRERL